MLYKLQTTEGIVVSQTLIFPIITKEHNILLGHHKSLSTAKVPTLLLFKHLRRKPEETGTLSI